MGLGFFPLHFMSKSERLGCLFPPCPGAGPKARTGAVAFTHRFGSSLTEHIHFHVVVIDGVFEPDSEQGARFIEAEGLDADNTEAVQTHVRRRILRACGAGCSKMKIARRWRSGSKTAYLPPTRPHVRRSPLWRLPR